MSSAHARHLLELIRVGGACGPPPPVAAALASSLRAPSRGDPPLMTSWRLLRRGSGQATYASGSGEPAARPPPVAAALATLAARSLPAAATPDCASCRTGYLPRRTGSGLRDAARLSPTWLPPAKHPASAALVRASQLIDRPWRIACAGQDAEAGRRVPSVSPESRTAGAARSHRGSARAPAAISDASRSPLSAAAPLTRASGQVAHVRHDHAAGGRRGKERAASLRAQQRLAAGGRRAPPTRICSSNTRRACAQDIAKRFPDPDQ